MYFLCMKTTDSAHNDFPLLTYTSDESFEIVRLAQNVYEGLVVTQSNPTVRPIENLFVIDDNFEQKAFRDAFIDLMAGKTTDFEWKFSDRYGRMIRCYITTNV